jgi:hypothetical protein
MASRKVEIGLVLAIAAIVAVVRALGGGEDSKAVAANDVRQALRELPYSYRFRDVQTFGRRRARTRRNCVWPRRRRRSFRGGIRWLARSSSPARRGRKLEMEEGVITTREAGDRGGRSGNPRANRESSPLTLTNGCADSDKL